MKKRSVNANNSRPDRDLMCENEKVVQRGKFCNIVDIASENSPPAYEAQNQYIKDKQLSEHSSSRKVQSDDTQKLESGIDKNHKRKEGEKWQGLESQQCIPEVQKKIENLKEAIEMLLMFMRNCQQQEIKPQSIFATIDSTLQKWKIIFCSQIKEPNTQNLIQKRQESELEKSEIIESENMNERFSFSSKQTYKIGNQQPEIPSSTNKNQESIINEYIYEVLDEIKLSNAKIQKQNVELKKVQAFYQDKFLELSTQIQVLQLNQKPEIPSSTNKNQESIINEYIYEVLDEIKLSNAKIQKQNVELKKVQAFYQDKFLELSTQIQVLQLNQKPEIPSSTNKNQESIINEYIYEVLDEIKLSNAKIQKQNVELKKVQAFYQDKFLELSTQIQVLQLNQKPEIPSSTNKNQESIINEYIYEVLDEIKLSNAKIQKQNVELKKVQAFYQDKFLELSTQIQVLQLNQKPEIPSSTNKNQESIINEYIYEVLDEIKLSNAKIQKQNVELKKVQAFYQDKILELSTKIQVLQFQVRKEKEKGFSVISKPQIDQERTVPPKVGYKNFEEATGYKITYKKSQIERSRKLLNQLQKDENDSHVLNPHHSSFALK